MNTLTSLILGVSSVLFAPSRTDFNFQSTRSPARCAAPRWTTAPAVSNNLFKGTAAISCAYSGKGGGGLPQLERFMIERMKKQATQIFSGPVYGQTYGMPSTRYDFAMEFPFQSSIVTLRHDGVVATDQHTRLISAMNSKSIQGEGMAKLLKKFDLRFDVTPGQTPNQFNATLQLHVEIQKPLIVPSGIFQNEVKKSIEESVQEYRQSVVTELEQNT